MKRLHLFTLTLAAIACIALGACDALSPTEERIGIVSLDFDCIEGPENVFRCTSSVTGGDRPLTYRWRATFLSEVSGVNASTVSFDYGDICDGKFTPATVRIILTVRDNKGEEAGPISKPYEICSPG